MSRILFVANDPAFFFDQHLEPALHARAKGFDVHVAAPDTDGASSIAKAGFRFHPVPITRGVGGLGGEAWSVFALARLYRCLQPDLVHHITLKPILYGTLAARMTGVPAVVNANTGFGYAFIQGGFWVGLLRLVLRAVYRYAVRHRNQLDLFLNPDDRSEFLSWGLVDESRSFVERGPGVDLTEFETSEEPTGRPIVVLPARMLWHKGVQEFVDAARILRSRKIDARFVLVGDPDSGNRSSVSASRLAEWHEEGAIEWWGYQRDMPAVYRQSAVVVLPSYREGLGRVLIEAGASGRPIVATDVPGCREVVLHGINGFLAEPRDEMSLVDMLQPLLLDGSLRRKFGASNREYVEREFDVRHVAANIHRWHLDMMRGGLAERTIVARVDPNRH